MKRKRGKPATATGLGPAQATPGPAEHARGRPHGPNLSDHDLRQMDPEWQQHQSGGTVRALLARALDDLRLARDRLSQTPANSSRPSGSMASWQRGGVAAGATANDGEPSDDEPSEVEPECEGPRPDHPPGDTTHPSEQADTSQSPSAAQRGTARCT